jgi:hypothetical protein
MTANVIAVTMSRWVQLIRRPIHQSIAQLMQTGMMMSGRTAIAFRPLSAIR